MNSGVSGECESLDLGGSSNQHHSESSVGPSGRELEDAEWEELEEMMP